MADMHPEDIKAAIRKRGSNLSALAFAADMNKQTLSLALTARVSAKAEQVIANFIERPAAEIWPSRYGADGKRTSMRRSKEEMELEAARKAARRAAA